MSSRSLLLLLGVAVLGVAAVICAAIAWTRVSQLSLPLPTALPALNILFPLLTALLFPLARRFVQKAKQHTIRLALPYLAHASTLLPFILFILSLVYGVPGDLRSCSLEQHWLRMFESKDDRGIRNIQTNLQCCGLNSIHDRAWPFPSRNVDARACETTQGYTVPCAGPWRNEEAFAATLTAVASFLNWLMAVLAVINFPQDEGNIRLPTWSAATRLIEENPENAEERSDTLDIDAPTEQQRVWRESQIEPTRQNEP